MKKIISILVFALLSSSAYATFKRNNIIETAQAAGKFKTLLTALELTGLTDTVAHTKKLTVFAPTDDAFAKLPDGTLEYLIDNPTVLKEILLYHVAPKKLKAKKVLKMNEIKTLAGKTIQTFKKEDGLFLNDAKVLKTDIKAKNGIIHVIDGVLTFDENTPNNMIETVEYVDLTKYVGKWYEIARYKNNFQEDCLGTTATYGTKGKFITVKNECQLANGKIQTGKALAQVVNKETNASLSVSFVPVLNRFGLFGGDYNVLALGPDYEYALVGDKKRDTFWILARTSTIADSLYEELLDVAESKGYRKDLINKSPVWK